MYDKVINGNQTVDVEEGGMNPCVQKEIHIGTLVLTMSLPFISARHRSSSVERSLSLCPADSAGGALDCVLLSAATPEQCNTI